MELIFTHKAIKWRTWDLLERYTSSVILYLSFPVESMVKSKHDMAQVHAHNVSAVFITLKKTVKGTIWAQIHV